MPPPASDTELVRAQLMGRFIEKAIDYRFLANPNARPIDETSVAYYVAGARAFADIVLVAAED